MQSRNYTSNPFPLDLPEGVFSAMPTVSSREQRARANERLQRLRQL